MYKDAIETQDAYAINQYNACCRYLDIPVSFDAEGETLLEKIVLLTEQLTIAREELNTAREDQAYMHKDLTIAFEQRDEYKAALQSADNHNHEIATKLEIVTEQRDSLHELHNKNAARSKELLELCGTLRKELSTITKQRDLLIKVLEITLNSTALNHKNERWHSDAEYALQLIKSPNQPTP